MKLDIKKIVPFLICFLVFVLLNQFKTVPMSQLWKGYRVLYVYSKNVTEDDVLAILEKHGCADVISRSNQRLPVVSSVAPVQAQDEDSYIFRRDSFFTDKSNSAMLFYIPETHASRLEKAVRELSAFQGTVAGTDGKSSFPWVAPIIVLAFFCLLFAFAKNRVLFTLGSVFMILLAFCRPLYSVSAGSALFVFAFFLFHRLWNRAGFMRTCLNSPYISVLALSPVLVILFASPLDALFYVLSALASLSLVYLFRAVEEKRERSYSFQPVLIRSATMIPVVGRIGIRLFSALVLCVALIAGAYAFSGTVSSLTESSSLPALPSPVASSSSELPDMSDMVVWTWNTVTFPYRKIDDNAARIPAENEAVTITDYIEADGKIVPVENTAYVFNAKFREMIYDSVASLDYPALEKLLLKQGKNVHYGYSKRSGSSASEKFAPLILLVFIAVPVVLGVYYIVGRKRYGLSI
mgnify:CR=1 FL=1